MQIVVIERNENGDWRDPETEQEYDLVEVQAGDTVATLKPIVEADSAAAYAASQGWEEVEVGT